MSESHVRDLRRALRPVPTYERAVKAVSKMLADAGIRHLLQAWEIFEKIASTPTSSHSLHAKAASARKSPVKGWLD